MTAMRRYALTALRVLITVVAVILALLVARWMWLHYQVAPWTRDGRVRADVVEVAPDVAGLVTSVAVADNQPVRTGQTLFTVDPTRYRLAVQQALAALASDKAILAEARREAKRNRTLGDLVAQEVREQSEARVQEAQATVDQAVSTLDTARLNLTRTAIVAPVNGVVTNLQLHPGDYMSIGRQALALVDRDSLHVDGYFEETKLPYIHVGDAVAVRVMGEPAVLQGHVESIAAAIQDRERAASPDLVANINPTFSWVRLAARVPVRVRLDAPTAPAVADVRLIAGRTATVTVLTPHPVIAHGPWWSFGS
jgi:multidrug resistance efflux pump